MSRCVVFLTLVAWVGVATVSAQFSCPAPPGLVCDPSLETGDHLSSAHFPAPEQCQAACSLGHPANPCRFFTWVAGAGPGVPNCHQLAACHAMAQPAAGATSGAWSCEDETLFCGAIAEVPVFHPRRTVWSCEHGVHPYGGGEVRVFQQTACYTSCPSFRAGASHRQDTLVTSTCRWDAAAGASVWGAAEPGGVRDSEGGLVQAADVTPSPACGCGDLVLTGSIVQQRGMVFRCLADPEYSADTDTTTIKDDNECSLICDGLPVKTSSASKYF